MLFVYIGCLTFGVAYAVVSAILGGHGSGHDGADMGGMDAGGVDIGGVDAGGIDVGGVDGGGIDIGGMDAGGLDGAGIDAGGIDGSLDTGGADGGGVHGHEGGHEGDTPSPFSPLVLASGISTFGAVGIIGKLGFGMGDMVSAIVSLGFAGAIGAAIFFGIVKFMYGSQSNSAFYRSELAGMEAEVITPIPVDGVGQIACIVNGVRHNLSARSAYREGIVRGATVRIREVAGNIAYVSQKMTIDDYERMEREKFKSGDSGKNKNM